MNSQTRHHTALLVALALLFLLLLSANLDAWLVADDEGTDFYEAWRLQQGEVPGRDFFAEQQPLFLYLGATTLDLFGHSVRALRSLAVVTVVLGALILALAVALVWDYTVAATALGLILSSGMVVEQARLFRPDPMMLGWEMAGLGAVIVAAHRQRAVLWGIAGAHYGIALLFKLFAVLPIVGLIFYFCHVFWRRRGEWIAWRSLLRQGLAFTAGFLLVGAGGSLLLYTQTGFYYSQALGQHLNVSRGTTVLQRVEITVRHFLALFLVNGVLFYWPALSWLNRRLPRPDREERRLLLWMLPAPLLFLLFTRPIYLRYYIFLIPVIMILLAVELQRAMETLEERHTALSHARPLFLTAIILFAAITTRRELPHLLLRSEGDTLALANFVAERTEPDEIVFSDYASINFHSRRPSIFEASIIAYGRISSGIVTGRMLVDRLEETQASLILLHEPGGEDAPDHLYYLQDFEVFRSYLDDNYVRTKTFDRQGQIIAVYERDEQVETAQ